MSDDLNKKNNYIPAFILVIAILILIISLSFGNMSGNSGNDKYKSADIHTEAEDEIMQHPKSDAELPPLLNSAYSQDLRINPLEEYNYKTKAEIYEIRKKYVKESLFYTPDYEPNEEIFGQIIDGKPWWGLEHTVCMNEKDNTTGISRLSTIINNPNILVEVGAAYTFHREPNMKWFCDSEFAKYIPFGLKYDADEKMITVKYKMSRYLVDNAKYYGGGNGPYYLTLHGLNAKDFGYRYMTIYDMQNISMRNNPNASEYFHEIADYIHLGWSCKKEGGCNNISPDQPELHFHITGLPAEISIGLRKSDSSYESSSYDFRYKIVFVEE